MKIAISSDERTHLTDIVQETLRAGGHELRVMGALAIAGVPWTEASEALAREVADGAAEMGVLFCFTGTGASIVANKVSGIRAALCADAQTAAGARRWNDANVLVMSLRATSPELAREILQAWFSTPVDAEEATLVAGISEIEARERLANPGRGGAKGWLSACEGQC